MIKLKDDLKKVIDKSVDFVALFKMTGDYVFDEEVIGVRLHNQESMLLKFFPTGNGGKYGVSLRAVRLWGNSVVKFSNPISGWEKIDKSLWL